MAKRIYWQSIKKWWKELVGSGVAITGISIFLMLSMMGAIDITGHSGDMRCAGTLEDPCVALINFTAKEDIFMYSMGYDPWGRNTVLQFDKPVKDWKMYRSWGNGWREIPLDKACTGTWCGLSNKDDTRKFAYAFREGRDYQIKIEALKENPTDTIKWAVNWEDKEYLDPAWEGVNSKFGVEVIGDKAVWQTDKGRIENTYQVSGFSTEIDLKLTSNISSQELRGCWVFPEKLTSASAKLNGTWNRDVSVNDYGNVTHSYTCNSSNFSYTLDPNYLWCYDETNDSLIWEGSFETGNLEGQTVYWNEWEVTGSHTEQESYDGFKDVSSAFSYQEVDIPIYEGKEHLYCADKYVEQGEEVWLKADVSRKAGLNLPSMKYWSCFWRASDTAQEAWDSGNIVCVDPQWDSSKTHYRNDTVSFTGNTGEWTYCVNGSDGFNLGSPDSAQYVWVQARNIDTINQMYYNNNTDYEFVNESDVSLYMDIEYGNVSQHDRDAWSNDLEQRFDLTQYDGSIVIDTMGNNNGTRSGSNITSSELCIFGNCMGSVLDNKINVDRLAVGESASSIDLWFRQTETRDANRIIYQFTNGDNYFSCYIKNDILECFTHEEGTVRKVSFDISSIGSYEWHHMVYMCNQSTAYLYVDGVQRDTLATVGDCIEDFGTSFTAWGSSSTDSADFKGYMDEIRFWNRELTADEVKASYLSGLSNITRLSILGAEQSTNTPPTISDIECYNGTDWKNTFVWEETIEQCRANCSDADGDSLITTLTLTNETTTQVDNLTNTSYSGGLQYWDFTDVEINAFGLWNVSITADDGTAKDTTNISWSVTNTAPENPAPEQSYEGQYVFNMTTDVNVSALYTDNEGQSGECFINVSKNDVIQFSANFSIGDGNTCSWVIEAENFTEPAEDWSAKFKFYDGANYSASNTTNWTTQLWQQGGGGGGDPLCVQYLQVDSFTGLTIEYNLTVQCVNSKADVNLTTVTITPYTDFGAAQTISVTSNSTNQTSFYNTTSRGTSDGSLYSIDGAVITENITLTTNAISNFVPIDPPYAFTKDGIVDCDQNMYVNKDIILSQPITFRGVGEFLISAMLKVTGINKDETDCKIVINDSGRMEVYS